MNRRDFLAATAGAAAIGEAAAAPIATTRAWEIGPPGAYATMRLIADRPVTMGPDDVLVKVSHSALAARDLGIARGWFLVDKPPELVPLSEGVGEVVATGERVRRLSAGERVTCVHFAGWVDGPWSPSYYAVDIGNTVDGWLAEHAVLPSSGVVALPDEVDDETAATLAGSGITAWQALMEIARVKPGETVLSLGTGGVSTWGVMLALASGARVAVTSSSDDKLARMRQLGATITVNYRTTPNWGEVIFDATGGRGVDVVLENVGRETLDQSLLACGNNARVIMIGTAPLPEQLPKMPGFYIKNIMLKAISNGSRRMLADMVRAVAANDIQAIVDRRFTFDRVPDAFNYMASSSRFGKVLIRHV